MTQLVVGRASAPVVDPVQVQKLRTVTDEFESVLVEMLLKQARQATSAFGEEEKNSAIGMYRDMQDEHLARAISRGGGVGLGQQLYQQLIKQLAP